MQYINMLTGFVISDYIVYTMLYNYFAFTDYN